MSREPDPAAVFGRRQLLGCAALVAGAALTACTNNAAKATTSSTGLSPTASPQPTSVPVEATAPAPQPAPTTAQLVPAAAVTVAESTAVVASSTPTPVVGGPAAYVAHGPAEGNSIALTFHLGGEPALVGELLDLLNARGVHSTLFAIGDWLTANPGLGHRAVDEGHELGNHTKSHKSMLKLARADVRTEIVGGGEALVPFIGSIGKWFRPSGTDVPNDVILEEAGSAGYAVSVGYDIDSRDYQEPGAAAVVARVSKQLHAGAIVSLHFGHRDTIDALPQILDLLTANGLTNTTVTGLLG